jgi:hypothetical protein
MVKKFPAFYGTRRFITVFTRARHRSLSWATNYLTNQLRVKFAILIDWPFVEMVVPSRFLVVTEFYRFYSYFESNRASTVIIKIRERIAGEVFKISLAGGYWKFSNRRVWVRSQKVLDSSRFMSVFAVWTRFPVEMILRSVSVKIPWSWISTT